MAWEVHKLLRSSYIRRRYIPPTDRQVYMTSFAIYGIALFASSLPLVGKVVEWIPEPGIQAGFLCLATTESLTHELVWWFVLVPIMFGLPYMYAAYVFYDVVFRSKLLPPKGKRRELTVFFFRIGTIFVFLWGPTFVGLFFLKGMISPWWSWGLGLFSHSQDMISALISMMKKDIHEAVMDFVFGFFRKSSADEDGNKKIEPSQLETTATSERVEIGESTYQEDSVDDLGLPIQGSDFQFLDEATHDGPASDRPNDSADCSPEYGDSEPLKDAHQDY